LVGRLLGWASWLGQLAGHSSTRLLVGWLTTLLARSVGWSLVCWLTTLCADVQGILKIVGESSAHFDAVNVATALHKLGSCHLGGGQLQQLLRQPEFATLKVLAGEDKTQASHTPPLPLPPCPWHTRPYLLPALLPVWAWLPFGAGCCRPWL
jgi:hypothetical protein